MARKVKKPTTLADVQHWVREAGFTPYADRTMRRWASEGRFGRTRRPTEVEREQHPGLRYNEIVIVDPRIARKFARGGF